MVLPIIGTGRSAARAAVLRARPFLSRSRLTGPSATLVGTSLVMNVLRIGNTIVLTRLLAPSDYGLVGIVMSIFFVIVMITDTGYQPFIVRHERGLERHFLDVVWTIHVLRGLANAALAMAVAVPLAALLHKPALAPLLAVAAISMAIDGAAAPSLFTALRQKMVRKLSLIDLAGFLVQLAVGLVAAWFLRNAWAFIIAIIAQSMTRTLSSFVLFPNARRRPRFDSAIASELWRFSRTVAASSTLTLMISQIDRLLLARLLSLQQFGIYSIAGSLAVTPTTAASLYTSRIMYPVLAENWRAAPERLQAIFYGMRGVVFYSYLTAAGGLIGAAPLIVRLLYDPRYEGATHYLHLLAITTAMYMLTKTMNEFLVAIGRVRATLEMNLVRAAWLLLTAVCGYLVLGAIGIVVSLALIELPAYAYGAWRLNTLGLFSLRRDLVAFATIGTGIALGVAGSAIILALLPIR